MIIILIIIYLFSHVIAKHLKRSLYNNNRFWKCTLRYLGDDKNSNGNH